MMDIIYVIKTSQFPRRAFHPSQFAI